MPASQYRNPVFPGSCPDPFVLKFNGVYYAYGTEAAGDGRYFPVLSSPDLVEWSFQGGALPPLAARDAREYWAPEVAYDNGIFYLYYAVIAFGTPEHHLRVATAARSPRCRIPTRASTGHPRSPTITACSTCITP